MKNRIKLRNLSQEQKYNLVSGGLATLLVGGTASLIHLFGTRSVSINDALTESDDMINLDDQDLLLDNDDASSHEDCTDVVEVETELEVINYETSSFGEAFKAARAENGPGHIFEYRGNTYTTYYAEEVEQMTPAEDEAFLQEIVQSTDGGEIYGIDDSATLNIESSQQIAENSTSETLDEAPSTEVTVEETIDIVPTVTEVGGASSETNDSHEDVVEEIIEDATTTPIITVDGTDFNDPAFGDASEQVVSSVSSEFSNEVVSVDLNDLTDANEYDETLLADASDSVSPDGTEDFIVVDDADFSDPNFGDVSLLAESSNHEGDASNALVDFTDFEDPAFGNGASASIANADRHQRTSEPEVVVSVEDDTDSDEDDVDSDLLNDIFEDDAFDSDL